MGPGGLRPAARRVTKGRVNILVLADLTEATDDAATARRIATHLGRTHRVTLMDATGIDPSSFVGLVGEQRIEAVVGVDALVAGPYLRALGLPYALVLGGTALYARLQPLQERELARAVLGAKRLVALSAANVSRAEWKWPAARDRIECIPPACDASAPNDLFSLRAALELDARDVLVLLPTAISAAKDPLHVVDAFHAWHRVEPRVHLAVVGPLLEREHAEEALSILAERPGVSYLPPLPRDRLLAAINEADVLINTSRSEGVGGALLDAMSIGTPVVARRNAGNEGLIVHGRTGFLYDAPEELVSWVRALVGSFALRRSVARAAGKVVRAEHSLEHERRAYLAVVRALRADVAPPVSKRPDDESKAAHSERRPGGEARRRDDERAFDATALASAATIGLDEAQRATLRALAARVSASPDLRTAAGALFGVLDSAPTEAAMQELRQAELERALGTDEARAFYLLLALRQVPGAEARHRARGIPEAITRATLGVLGGMASRNASCGISLEALEDAQRFLRGERLSVGGLQVELRPFAGPVRVFRHRTTGERAAITLDGRPVDLASGVIGGEATAPGPWDTLLEPGVLVLEAQVPAEGMAAPELMSGAREAVALFARLTPALAPVALTIDSWRLDPALGALLPDLAPLQRALSLHPSLRTEADVLRELFGVDIARDALETFPRERMSAAQRAVADFLASPAHALSPRAGFLPVDALHEDAEA